MKFHLSFFNFSSLQEHFPKISKNRWLDYQLCQFTCSSSGEAPSFYKKLGFRINNYKSITAGCSANERNQGQMSKYLLEHKNKTKKMRRLRNGRSISCSSESMTIIKELLKNLLMTQQSVKKDGTIQSVLYCNPSRLTKVIQFQILQSTSIQFFPLTNKAIFATSLNFALLQSNHLSSYKDRKWPNPLSSSIYFLLSPHTYDEII